MFLCFLFYLRAIVVIFWLLILGVFSAINLLTVRLFPNKLLNLRLILMSHQVENLAYFHLDTPDPGRSIFD